MELPDEYSPIGEAIRKTRGRCGMTIEEVAKKAGVRENTLRILEGAAGNPTFRQLIRIAYALDTPAFEIVKMAEEDTFDPNS